MCAEAAANIEPFGARAPGPFDRAIIECTRRMPDNWLGLRLAILMRRVVTMRLPGDVGLDVERWSLRLRLHPRRNGCEKDRGGNRTRPLDAGTAAGLRVECKTLASVLARENVTRIDALKIDVEGAEDRILVPFFNAAPENLWPRFMIIEDTHELWRDDPFAILGERGYRGVARTKLNVMVER